MNDLFKVKGFELNQSIMRLVAPNEYRNIFAGPNCGKGYRKDLSKGFYGSNQGFKRDQIIHRPIAVKGGNKGASSISQGEAGPSGMENSSRKEVSVVADYSHSDDQNSQDDEAVASKPEKSRSPSPSDFMTDYEFFDISDNEDNDDDDDITEIDNDQDDKANTSLETIKISDLSPSSTASITRSSYWLNLDGAQSPTINEDEVDTRRSPRPTDTDLRHCIMPPPPERSRAIRSRKRTGYNAGHPYEARQLSQSLGSPNSGGGSGPSAKRRLHY